MASRKCLHLSLRICLLSRTLRKIGAWQRPLIPIIVSHRRAPLGEENMGAFARSLLIELANR